MARKAPPERCSTSTGCSSAASCTTASPTPSSPSPPVRASPLTCTGRRRPGLLAALADVKQVSADALASCARPCNAYAGHGSGPRRSGQPSRLALQELMRPLGLAGLRSSSDCDPAADQVPARVSHAGYRIVQESLTNVLRHAQARTVTVTVLVLDDQLAIDVVNDGPLVGATRRPSRRARSTRDGRTRHPHGRHRAGRSPRSGGWHVSARLPMTGCPR